MISIGITGIIGSGKSVVAQIFETLNIPVYNADLNAKSLMNSQAEIKDSLIKNFGQETYNNQSLNKEFLATIIFNNEEKRKLVNSIVHPVVIRDFMNWKNSQSTSVIAIESALLYESNINEKVDFTITVESDIETRIKRICSRDNITESEAEKRIQIQQSYQTKNSSSDFIIKNNEADSLILQVLQILEIINKG